MDGVMVMVLHVVRGKVEKRKAAKDWLVKE